MTLEHHDYVESDPSEYGQSLSFKEILRLTASDGCKKQEQPSIDPIVVRDEINLPGMLRSHGETLGRQGKPASRELLRDAANEIEELTIYKQAMESMAAQFIHPKMTAREMAELQLKDKGKHQ